MAFIDTLPAASATGEVLAMYQRQESEWGYVPDYAKVFCHRPEVMERWGRLLAAVKRPVDARRRELVTFAAAFELRHSSCSLAHGHQLAKLIGKEAVLAIARGRDSEVLNEAECAMLRFARRIASDASAITAAEVTALKAVHGFSDEEVFDIAAIAAARCFFSKLLDALGSQPDLPFLQLDEELRRDLTVGRPISTEAPERTGGERAVYPVLTGRETASAE